MILIFDNGYDYSDHALHFIEIGNVAVEHAVTLCKLRYSGGFLLGRAERIEWREGDATDDLISFASASLPGCLDEDGDGLPDVPLELLLRLYDCERTRVDVLLKQSAGNPHWNGNVQVRSADLERVRARIAALK